MKRSSLLMIKRASSIAGVISLSWSTYDITDFASYILISEKSTKDFTLIDF